MDTDYAGLKPNMIREKIEDYFFPINTIVTPDQLIEQIKKARDKATKDGYKNLRAELDSYESGEFGETEPHLIVSGERLETDKEVASRRHNYIVGRYSELCKATGSLRWFKSEQGKAELAEMKEAGLDLRRVDLSEILL